MSQVTDIQTPDDERELRPAERARLATLAIQLAYDGDDAPSDVIDEQVRRLQRVITDSSKQARREHWQPNSAAPQQAARVYREAQSSGQPVSLADVATQFGTSERSVSRYVAKLKAE